MAKALGLLWVLISFPVLAGEKVVLSRDIAAGEVFEHTGPLVLRGNVGEGARMTIHQGGLEVQGGVADGA